MSSTLFGRGTNTQVGGKKRAEDQERLVLSIRTAVEEVKATAATLVEVKALTARVTSLEATIAALQKTVTALATTGGAATATAAVTTAS